MSIEQFRLDADRVLRHFDLRRAPGPFGMQVEHVYSGDPVARTWCWTHDGDAAAQRACVQMLVILRVVAGQDWHVLDFGDAALRHRRPQAGAAELGRARGEWHILSLHGSAGEATLEAGYMLFEQEVDFAAVRDELLQRDTA